jgi:hypothetical protein
MYTKMLKIQKFAEIFPKKNQKSFFVWAGQGAKSIGFLKLQMPS